LKIVALETLRPALQPNLLFLRLHTDVGPVGLGEAFYGARAIEEYLHESVAPILLGATDPTPERVARKLDSYVGYQGAGAETRGNGAVDLALWDLLGKSAELPLVQMLGGPYRDSVPIYNTCAGPGYVSTSGSQSSDNWGLPQESGPYEDLHAFLTEPARLARQLWNDGVRGMKVWPFDQAAERSGGTDITRAELDQGLAVIEAIRGEVGLDMDVMVELHGLWNRPAAEKIMNALLPYQPYWVEDPIRPDAVNALATLARDTDLPIATGETCIGRRGFMPLLHEGAVDVVTVDVGWTGGITEARKVASLADGYGVPVAPHDCSGPVALAASTALVASQPNGLVQETVRAFLNTWYPKLVTGLPLIESGEIRPSRRPGHGVQLVDRVLDDDGMPRRISQL